jgi:hypothetical protein
MTFKSIDYTLRLTFREDTILGIVEIFQLCYLVVSHDRFHRG